MIIALVDVERSLRTLTIVSWSSGLATSTVSSQVKRLDGTVPIYDGCERRFCSRVDNVVFSLLYPLLSYIEYTLLRRRNRTCVPGSKANVFLSPCESLPVTLLGCSMSISRPTSTCFVSIILLTALKNMASLSVLRIRESWNLIFSCTSAKNSSYVNGSLSLEYCSTSFTIPRKREAVFMSRSISPELITSLLSSLYASCLSARK